MAINSSGAVISECGLYRYRLWRRWDDSLRPLAFIMLNPSTADQSVDDQTIRKCMGFARRLGYGSIDIVNLFAFRTRWPSELKDAGFPVGPENDNHIRTVAAESGGKIVCAWGSNAKGLKRVDDIFDLLKANSAQPFALRINAGGVPAHPVMLPYACTPIPLRTTR